MRYQSRSKYGNKKVYRYDRWFDSIAEADYYPIAVAYARKHEYELKLQERLDILPTLKINPWTIKKNSMWPIMRSTIKESLFDLLMSKAWKRKIFG